jgi:hypothetical protein
MRQTLLLLPLVFAACQPIDGLGGTAPAVADGPLRVVAAEAGANNVLLRLSDGSRCRAARPEGTQSDWSGVTDPECGHALPVTVAYRQGGSPQRFEIEDPRGTMTRDGLPGPRAEVFVTDVDGQRRLFVTPLARGTRLVDAPVG